MNEASDEELGPIDLLVVEFPAGEQNFTGAMAEELLSLIEAGTIRILELLVIQKGTDESLEVLEIEDLGGLGELGIIEATMAEILAEEDLIHIAAAMEPGSTAGVLVWENSWATKFSVAARESGAQLIANERIHTQALIAAFEADEAEGSD